VRSRREEPLPDIFSIVLPLPLLLVIFADLEVSSVLLLSSPLPLKLPDDIMPLPLPDDLPLPLPLPDLADMPVPLSPLWLPHSSFILMEPRDFALRLLMLLPLMQISPLLDDMVPPDASPLGLPLTPFVLMARLFVLLLLPSSLSDDMLPLPVSDDMLPLPLSDDMLPLPLPDDILPLPLPDDMLPLPLPDDMPLAPFVLIEPLFSPPLPRPFK
jgi:hypothetical protein